MFVQTTGALFYLAIHFTRFRITADSGAPVAESRFFFPPVGIYAFQFDLLHLTLVC